MFNKITFLIFILSSLFIQIFIFAQEDDDSLQFIRSKYFVIPRQFPYDSIPSVAYSNACSYKLQLDQQYGYFLGSANISWVPLGPAGGTSGSYTGRTKLGCFNPQNDNQVFIATSGSGLWQTNNFWDVSNTNVQWNHTSWISNVIDVLPGGSICFDPFDQTGNTIYYGTGEPTDMWGLTYMGNGIYVSTDGGNSWTKGQGLPSQTKVYKICIRSIEHHNIVYAALGTTYWENPYGTGNGTARNCGLYISTDFGVNWTVVISNLHCTDIAFSNDLKGYCLGPRASTPPNTYLPGTDYRMTTDGGLTWSDPAQGESHFDHVGYNDNTFITISPTYPNIMYVLTCGDGGTIVYRSTNAGLNFNWIGNNHFNAMWDYNMFIKISPWDPNIVFVGCIDLEYTINGLTDPPQVNWQSFSSGNYHGDVQSIDIDQYSGQSPINFTDYKLLLTCDD